MNGIPIERTPHFPPLHDDHWGAVFKMYPEIHRRCLWLNNRQWGSPLSTGQLDGHEWTLRGRISMLSNVTLAEAIGGAEPFFFLSEHPIRELEVPLAFSPLQLSVAFTFPALICFRIAPTAVSVWRCVPCFKGFQTPSTTARARRYDIFIQWGHFGPSRPRNGSD